MHHFFRRFALLCWLLAPLASLGQNAQTSRPIHFDGKPLPLVLENSETPAHNMPETMVGGVAVFDYNNDGRPDIFFANGANISTLRKDDPKYRNRLYRNDGNGSFTDVTEAVGLAGAGYDIGVAAADYDNDGFADLFVAGVHRNTLYRNNGNGTFTDVTEKAGLGSVVDPEFGPLWAITAVWADVNNDGLLDLFVVNYLQWAYSSIARCPIASGGADYCHPRFFKGQPNTLYLNNGDGTFRNVSKEWGVRSHVGKGMGVGLADYDQDGKPDLFVTNDGYYNYLFHNKGSAFEEVAFDANVALVEDGAFISGMGLDFRDIDNDGFPDLGFVALANQTFPFFLNTGKGDFRETTAPAGMRDVSRHMSGFGAAFYDLDNDGWKDFFVSGGHVQSVTLPGQNIEELNFVFRNPGRSGKWTLASDDAGLRAGQAARHRGCALADFDGDGRVDIVVSAIQHRAELWLNRTSNSGHWLEVQLRGVKSNRDGIGAVIKVVTESLTQYNHKTTSVCYASSSDAPVHFGLASDSVVHELVIRWPSGVVQTLRNQAVDRVLNVVESQ